MRKGSDVQLGHPSLPNVHLLNLLGALANQAMSATTMNGGMQTDPASSCVPERGVASVCRQSKLPLGTDRRGDRTCVYVGKGAFVHEEVVHDACTPLSRPILMMTL